MKEHNVIFMGTPDFSVPILEYLAKNVNVSLVVTKMDKEVGRDKVLTFSPVKKKALELGLEVFTPKKLREDFQIIKDKNPDLIITCAYGQILSKEVLDIPKYGCINIHASLLPKYRGASPMQACLLNGDDKTGVTLMYMDEGMDTGDIISMKECVINDDDNLENIHDRLSLLGVEILKENLDKLFSLDVPRIKQNDEEATYTHLIKREDELLDFNDNGINIINKIRAFTPYPLCYFTFEGKEIKIIKAHYEKCNVNDINKIVITKKEMGIMCKDGIIYLDIIKPMGKKEMEITSFINGIKKDSDYYANR